MLSLSSSRKAAHRVAKCLFLTSPYTAYYVTSGWLIEESSLSSGLVMRIRAFAAVKNDMFGARGGMFTTCKFLASARFTGWAKCLVSSLFCAAGTSVMRTPLSITYGNEGGERAGVSDERFKTDVVLQFAYGCISFRIQPCWRLCERLK